MSGAIQQEEVHELIRLIYEAAGNARLWPTFLAKFGALVQASAVGLVVQDSGSRKMGVDVSVGVDPAYQREFVDHYGAVNPWTAPNNAALWIPGSVVGSQQIMSDVELVKTEFYNGFLRPQKWLTALGGSITREDKVTSYITALRPPRAGAINAHEYRLLELLMPHLQCAMRLHQRVATLETALTALADTIDYLPGGVIIADAQGRVLVVNQAAEKLLANSDGLRNWRDGIFASRQSESRALRNAMANAVAARDGGLSAPRPLRISRSGARKPLQVLVAPLPAQTTGMRRQPAAVLFISDPEDGQERNRALLQRAFALTDTEARVAMALTEGKSVQEIAEKFGVTLATIRGHLKRVFSKTDTRRQGELIHLLLTGWKTVGVNGLSMST